MDRLAVRNPPLLLETRRRVDWLRHSVLPRSELLAIWGSTARIKLSIPQKEGADQDSDKTRHRQAAVQNRGPVQCHHEEQTVTKEWRVLLHSDWLWPLSTGQLDLCVWCHEAQPENSGPVNCQARPSIPSDSRISVTKAFFPRNSWDGRRCYYQWSEGARDPERGLKSKWSRRRD